MHSSSSPKRPRELAIDPSFYEEWAEPILDELEAAIQAIRSKQCKIMTFRYIDPPRLEATLDNALAEARPTWRCLPVGVAGHIFKWLSAKEAWRICTKLSRSFAAWIKGKMDFLRVQVIKLTKAQGLTTVYDGRYVAWRCGWPHYVVFWPPPPKSYIVGLTEKSHWIIHLQINESPFFEVCSSETGRLGRFRHAGQDMFIEPTFVSGRMERIDIKPH